MRYPMFRRVLVCFEAAPAAPALSISINGSQLTQTGSPPNRLLGGAAIQIDLAFSKALAPQRLIPLSQLVKIWCARFPAAFPPPLPPDIQLSRAAPAPSRRIPTAVFRRRARSRSVGSPFRGFSRPVMSQ
jgi:hypothetical protein